ncbi:YraN family protein [Candidatus Methylomirabilis sp.]|jgi:putative endonuclease|uniref:YraN family protein n=1 Tax=Candidatus Methylomirabilis sp. TaxID=2032687 RepID=UPI003C73C2A8
MKAGRLGLGAEGERVAKAYLQTKGFRILHENYSTPLGEIDLIAKESGVVVFVEVKARTSGEFGPPQASVTLAKQRQIVKVARLYLQRERLAEVACRFDVVAVMFAGGQAGQPNVLLIRDAFSSEGIALF